MRKNLVKYLALGVAGLGFFAVDPAMAAVTGGLNTLSGNVTGQMPAVASLLSSIAYIAGIGFGIKAILKFKEHNESKGQVPLSQPIVMAVVAGLLLALPSFLTVAKEAAGGSSTQQTTISGGGLSTL